MFFRVHKSLATVVIVFLVFVLGIAGVIPAQASAGTYQFGTMFRVTPTGATSGACGSDWSTPCDLQWALTQAASGAEVWVSQGTYKPGTTDRESTFLLKEGVAVYGGFAGTETLRSQRNSDPATNNTVLSGDIGTAGIIVDNAYHVVRANLLTSAILDGFTITQGNANGETENFGGGLYINESNLTLTNIIFSNNTTNGGGGGLFAISQQTLRANYSTPVLNKVIFTGNTAVRGGGMFTQNSSPTLTNVIFTGNTASGGAGGGMNNQLLNNTDEYSIPILTNVTFSGNTANGGGGLFNGVSHPVLTNVTFSGNIASIRGGAILNEGASPTLNNVTISSNLAPEGTGSAVRNIDATGGFHSNPVFNNTILWGNGTEELVNDADNTATITDSVVLGGCPALSSCTNVITGNPNFGALADNGGFTQTRALNVDSSAINAGGVNSTCALTDQRGAARPQGSACDIGAFEAYLLTVTADPQTITYGQADPVFSFQYSGFVDGDTGAVIDTPPTCGVSGAHADAGTYTIACAGGADTKYVFFAYVDGTLTVNKADPTLSVTNSPVIYDATPHAATVTGSVPGTPGNILTGGSASQTDAGTYAVTADFVPNDTDNYNSLTAAPAGTFIIDKADPILSVTNSPVTYDAAPHAAAVTSSVPGTPGNILTGGATTQTDAGTYAVTADFVPTDTANYNSLTAAPAGNFVINKANPTLSVTNSPVVYNAAPQAATVTGSVPGTASNILTGGSAAQTDAGTYAVTADFVPTDTDNYNSLTAAPAGNFIIDKADPTLSVTNSPVVYNAAPQAAAVTGSVPGTASNILTGGAASQTDAGTYAVIADFTPTDTDNYNSLTAASAGDFTIDKADPILSVTNSPVLYNGLPHSAIVTGSVPGTVSNTLTGGSAAQIGAGTYAVTADFIPADTDNYNNLTGASAGNFVVNKATPTLSVTNSPVEHDGSPHAAAVTGSVPGTVSNILTGGSATQTDVGTYAVTADFVPTDSDNFSTLSGAPAGNFVISPDVTPPGTQMLIRPGSPSSSSVSFSFTSEDGTATFECQLDGGGFSVCTSPKDYIGLADGTHTFDVRARDLFDNIDATPASYTWTVITNSAKKLNSKVVSPVIVIDHNGATNGSTPSLGLLQQSGTDDTPGAYVAFQTPGSTYTGYQSFTLPSDIRPALISTMLMQVNFKGPAASAQTWTWSIYDWNTGMWIKLGDTTGTIAGQWNTLTLRIQSPWRYISSENELRIQLRSNNANGDALVDYEALHITYRPYTPPPAQVVPTTPARRPGISSAPSTPTPSP